MHAPLDSVPDLQRFKRTADDNQMIEEIRTGGQTSSESPAQARSPWMEEKGTTSNIIKHYRHEKPR